MRASPIRTADTGLSIGADDAIVEEARQLLAAYGYGVGPAGALDEGMATALSAFQRHFRPARVDGRLDISTLRTLRRLVEALKTSASSQAG